MSGKDFNLRIPLDVIKGYPLPANALLLYAELYGFRNKPAIYISQDKLSQRLKSNVRTIRRNEKKLRDNGLIDSKRKPRRKGRYIILNLDNIDKSSFILIPSLIYSDDITARSKIIYGLLNKQASRIGKIYNDVWEGNGEDSALTDDEAESFAEDNGGFYDSNMNDIVIYTTKPKLASYFYKANPRTISRSLNQLADKGYIYLNPDKGKRIEIEVLDLSEIENELASQQTASQHPSIKDNSQPMTKMSCENTKPMTKRTPKNDKKNDSPSSTLSTYDKNVLLPMTEMSCENTKPMTKMSCDIGQKCPPNISSNGTGKNNELFNRLNSDKLRVFQSLENDYQKNILKGKPLTKPLYYDSIPDEDDIPPEPKDLVNKSEIEELNKLDSAKSSQDQFKVANQNHRSKTVNQDQKSGEDAESNSTTDQSKPETFIRTPIIYKGYNIDFFIVKIKQMLNKATGKRYIIAQSAKQAIGQRLEEGFTLDDFKQAIYNLTHQGKSISIRQLAAHLKEYLNPATPEQQ